MMNDFLKANILGAGANGAMTENGAISYATFGSNLLDQFGKSGSYRNRDIEDVWYEQRQLWAENPLNALKFPFYLRMITRQSNILGKGKTEKVQKGQGARDESFKRMLWIAKYHPDEFYRNLWLLPVVGSWKDLWVLLSMDDSKDLDIDKFYEVIASGINDEYHKELVKKFMPRIRSERKCTTNWSKKTNELAKGFARFAGWSYKDYREFKSTGKAHEFQKVICNGLYSQINWNTIPGKALINLINGKFLSNHSLENSYIDWLVKQPTVKFNGYPFELAKKLSVNSNRINAMTVDRQFDNLIKTAEKDGSPINGNVLCAIDTSGSMNCPIDNSGTSAFDVCVSLGIYFSSLNKGAFHDIIAMFDHNSTLKKLNGTFSDKWFNILSSTTAWGDTNFQSLIDLIVSTRIKSPEIPLEDYPQTLLIVSDMQFNPTGTNESNYQAAIKKLSSVFPKEFCDKFKIIWWFCSNNRTTDFPSTMDDAGTYMISGFDGAVISFLLGGEEKVNPNTGKVVQPSMEDIINDAFSQEVLSLIQ